MAKSKVEITKELKNDLEKYSSKVAVGLATKVRDDLIEATVYAIAAFYMDYTPKYYKRHYYNFMNNSYEKYYRNAHGNIVYGGVFLSPSGMDDIYQDETQEVFDLVYAGYHGVSSGFETPKSFTSTPVMTPSPLEIIKNERDNIVSNIEAYKTFGTNRANKENYSVIYK